MVVETKIDKMTILFFKLISVITESGSGSNYDSINIIFHTLQICIFIYGIAGSARCMVLSI